jgi:hypothetical protein
MIMRIAGAGLAVLALGACSSATGGVPLDRPSATPSESSTQPTPAQWCSAYASITGVLSNTGNDKESASMALAALERFDLLWGVADNMGIVSSDEVAANQRMVAAYRSVLTLIAGGAAADSPEVKAARVDLEAAAEKDRTDLKSSAGRVLGRCGDPSPTPST